MLDVLVEVRHNGVEEGEEVLIVRGHVLKLVEVFLDLVAVSHGLRSLNRCTHRHMLLSVHVGQLLSLLTKLLLHDRVHGQLLTDCMACESPSELVPPFNLLLQGARSLDIFGIQVDGSVVSTNGFGDGSLLLVVGGVA